MRPDLHDLDDATWITHPAWAGSGPPRVYPWCAGREPSPPAFVPRGLQSSAWASGKRGSTASSRRQTSLSQVSRRLASARPPAASTSPPPPRLEADEVAPSRRPGRLPRARHPGRYTKFARLRVAPRARAALVVELADGRTQRHVSGPGWGAVLGPTTLSHWYGGEDYDARLEPEGWHTTGGTSGDPWVSAVVVATPEEGPQPWIRQAPPMRVVDVVEEQGRTLLADGATIDFGRNLAGRQVLRVGPDFPAGARVEMLPAEYVNDDGRVDQSSTGGPIKDTYTAAGGAATWRPRFCYHGFRYLQLRVVGPDGELCLPTACTSGPSRS